MIFGFLVPSIKEYKQVKYESRMQIAASAQTQRLYDTKSKALNEIKQNDKAVLDARSGNSFHMLEQSARFGVNDTSKIVSS